MKLNSLIIKNFRGYRDIKIPFNENLNLIIGRNDVGKSTILDAPPLARICNPSVTLPSTRITNPSERHGCWSERHGCWSERHGCWSDQHRYWSEQSELANSAKQVYTTPAPKKFYLKFLKTHY